MKKTHERGILAGGVLVAVLSVVALAMGRQSGDGTAYSSPQTTASQSQAQSPVPYDSNAAYSGTSHVPVAPGNQPLTRGTQGNPTPGSSTGFPVTPAAAGMPGSPGVSGTGAPQSAATGNTGAAPAGGSR